MATNTEDYFTSDLFMRRCDAHASESFEIISGPKAKTIHENYVKAKKNAKTTRTSADIANRRESDSAGFKIISTPKSPKKDK